MEKPVYVIGHKNPDSDSVCSAISYARLKTLVTGKTYIPKRAGHINEETHYILERWGVQPPEYIKDVRPQVSEVSMHEVDGVDRTISIKKAWRIMQENNTVTLPIIEDGQLNGLISIGDITKSYFEIYDSSILAKAVTKFSNIVDTLEGRVVTGDTDQIVDCGKVLIATANPDMMENYIDAGDIVVLGNRYEAQLCAIEMRARCIIICDGAEVSKTITKLAQEYHCAIVITKYDTYTVARLINQSMPISFYMTPKEKLIKFKTTDFVEDIREIMAKHRFRDFPILDPDGNYLGMISRRNLIMHERKKLILVDHNEKAQAVEGVETADILEIIDHHRLGSIETISPVYFRNQPLGCTATIIYQMYGENGLVPEKTIAALLCSAIISDTLILKSPTCTQADVDACQALAEIAGIDIEEYGREMFKAGSNLSSRTPKELFERDFKRFSVNDVNIGIGQVNCMEVSESEELRTRMDEYIRGSCQAYGLNMTFFMITNVLDESSRVVCSGNNAVGTLCRAFNTETQDDTVFLPGVVSRKKQILPAIMEALQG
jgi:manganese-dependent inorganic pyrophosphatase